MELDATPHVLIVVRGADDPPPRELPAELSAAAVEVTEDQVSLQCRICYQKMLCCGAQRLSQA